MGAVPKTSPSLDDVISRLESLSGDAFQRELTQAEQLALQHYRPRPWQHPYTKEHAEIIIPNALHRVHDEDELFRDVLIYLWQRYFPHYRVMLRRMAEGQEGLPLETHLQYIQGTWYAPFLAYEFVRANRSRWAFLNKLWLWLQLSMKEYTAIAREYRIPLVALRFAMAWHNLAPVSGWRKWLWVIGLVRHAVPAPQGKLPPVEIVDHIAWEETLFVRLQESPIFKPLECVIG